MLPSQQKMTHQQPSILNYIFCVTTLSHHHCQISIDLLNKSIFFLLKIWSKIANSNIRIPKCTYNLVVKVHEYHHLQIQVSKTLKKPTILPLINTKGKHSNWLTTTQNKSIYDKMGFRVYGLPTLEELINYVQRKSVDGHNIVSCVSCSSGCCELFYYGSFWRAPLKMGLMNLFSFLSVCIIMPNPC